MSLKATLYIETKKKDYEVSLSTLTMESLTSAAQKLWFSLESKRAAKEFEITDKDNTKIEKNKDVERVCKNSPVHFNVRIKPKKYIKRKGQLNIQQNHIMINPLVLLAGTIRHKTSNKSLNSVKRDMIELKHLFAKRDGYTVISTYDNDDNSSEILTLERLNKTLSNEFQDITTYDGLIFIWCGYGNDQTGTLTTSDDKHKHWNEIVNMYETITTKPKIIIQNCIDSKALHEMKTDEISSWSRFSGSNVFFITTNLINDDPTGNTGSIFTKLFCEQLNEDNNYQVSLNSMIEAINYTIKDKFTNEKGQKLIKTCSSCDKDIYFGTEKYLLYNYIEDTDTNWMKAIKKAEAMTTEMMEHNQKGIIVVASWSWELNDDASTEMKEEQNPMKQKYVVGDFTIALFHCKSVRFEEIIIYGRVYPLISIPFLADFNDVCELAITKYDNYDYESTIKYSLYALSLTEQNPSVNSSLYYILYSDLAWSYFQCEKYEKARYYFEKELEIYSKQTVVDNSYIRNCFENLGITLCELKQYDKAIYYLEQALSIWLEKFDTNDELVGKLYTDLGICFFHTNQFEKEKECYKKSLEIYLKVFSNMHFDVAIAYYNLGCMYQRQKLYDKALEYHEKSLDIRIKLWKNDHSIDPDCSEEFDMLDCLDVDVGCSYHCIALTLRKKGEFEKAISYHEKGLRILRNNFDVFDPDAELGDSYKSLGIAYEKIENKIKAIENYENAVFTLHAKFGATHKKTLSALAKLKRMQES
ncbi:hypothetical protein RFI_26119 [Reticulomyxa filosa]|uniref:Peptidase C14 caspase domain-containing protein n=1 Tax=Reticulomyxa filosa TaxID=46433 RepID=X6MB65_RETFI|nr:hypothetical protein RFI_26119 [Reticulomyxa filosa]|eukprot:ETO11258.1 hypothetical protein RFI_26119 [Reticulomyxa filosa]